MPTKAIVAVALGVAALAVLIAADVQQWGLSAVAAGMLGSFIGFVPGYLAPSPRERGDRMPVARARAVQPAEPAPESPADAVPSPLADATTKRMESDGG